MEARRDGLDPELFGRLPLVRPDDEPVEHPSSPLAQVRRFLVVRSDWLWIVQVAVLVVLPLIARGIWLHRRLRERRADRALESHRSLS